MVNRRMFRPGFQDVKEQNSPRMSSNGPGPAPSKKPAPPETTHAENFYWVKQMQTHTPMMVVLESGEELRGTIEWYDRDCIKLTRQGSPNLLIFKRVIKYVHKDGEERRRGERSRSTSPRRDRRGQSNDHQQRRTLAEPLRPSHLSR